MERLQRDGRLPREGRDGEVTGGRRGRRTRKAGKEGRAPEQSWPWARAGRRGQETKGEGTREALGRGVQAMVEKCPPRREEAGWEGLAASGGY